MLPVVLCNSPFLKTDNIRYGGQLGEQNICNFAEVMKALMALVFGAMNTGQVSAYLPDAAEARVAATRIFRILDRRSEIDPLSESGDKVVRCTNGLVTAFIVTKPQKKKKGAETPLRLFPTSAMGHTATGRTFSLFKLS